MVECLVLPGVGGLAVQALLAACCLGVFYIKRQKEEKSLGVDARTKEEFVLDASKQFAGAAWLHVLNLAFASVLNGLMSGGDECEWYWINILVDTTVGTGVVYFLLKIASAFVKKRFGPEGAVDFKSGEYREEDGIISMKKYGKQLTVWLVVVSGMKILMIMFMFIFSGPLTAFAGFILAPFLTQPWLKLVFVMIAFPLLMDAFQIWMIDNFIKKRVEQFGVEHDPEAAYDPYVEASADALLAFSQRAEEVLVNFNAEEALTNFKARYDEVTSVDQPPRGAVHASPNGRFDTLEVPITDDSDAKQKFSTIIPPDQSVE